MNKPLISVVIPNYNRGHLIKDVIDSVIKQTYDNWEIVVVDDHSTDNSMSALNRLQQEMPNLTIYQLEKNSGANSCRNKGVELAKGDYIAFLDSDDYFLPTKLEMQLEVFEQHPDVSFVVTGFGMKSMNSLSEGKIPLKDTIKQNNLGGFSTVMIKKEAFLAVGGLDIDLPSCQDWDLFLKLLGEHKGYKLAEDLVAYEMQEDSISKSLDKVIGGYETVSKRAKALNDELELIPEKDLESYQAYYLAMRYFKLRDIKNTRKYLKQSLSIKPSLAPLLYLPFAYLGYRPLKAFIGLKNKFGR